MAGDHHELKATSPLEWDWKNPHVMARVSHGMLIATCRLFRKLRQSEISSSVLGVNIEFNMSRFFSGVLSLGVVLDLQCFLTLRKLFICTPERWEQSNSWAVKSTRRAPVMTMFTKLKEANKKNKGS